MKPKLPEEVEIKLLLANQCQLSIDRLRGYEDVFSQMSIDYPNINIPPSIRQRIKEFVESQILIEKSNIENYGKS